MRYCFWVTALEAGKTQNTFPSEIKDRCLPWLLNLCPPIPADRDWHGHYHVCFPPKMIEVKFVLFSHDFYSDMGQGWWSVLGLTQIDQRQTWARNGTDRTQQEQGAHLDWATAVAFQGGSLLGTFCFSRKQGLQKNSQIENMTLLKGTSCSVTMQLVSVLGNELRALAYLVLGTPRLPINISLPTVWEIIHHYAQNLLCGLRENMTHISIKPGIYCYCNKNLNGLL